ncbi:MAG: xanthine dehydrogenase family protein subunit M [Thermodesulfobacteriota bacterium]
MKSFEYYAPDSLEEAADILARFSGRAAVLAGGTDLIPDLKRKKRAPECLVNIKNIVGLRAIEEEEGGLKIGSLTTIQDVIAAPRLSGVHGLLRQAAVHLATPQIRVRATVGGNICHASPAADLAPPLMALDSRAIIQTPRGRLRLALDDFFLGPRRTALGPEDLLVGLTVPRPEGAAGTCFLKIGRTKMADLALVNVAVFVELSRADRRCCQARIVLGAVAPTPIRARRAEEMLVGNMVGHDLIEETARSAAEETQPISDVRASREYRKEMARVLTVRALRAAVDLAETAAAA